MTSSGLPPLSMEELACVYSACILADDDIPVTQEKLTTLLKAAELEVEPIWPMLYARALSGVNIREMICKAGPCGISAAGAGPVPGTTAADSAEQPAQNTQKEETKPVESEEDSEDDMGFGLFD